MRLDVWKWKMMMMLVRLDLIEMVYESEFRSDGTVGVGIDVHPSIRSDI